MIRKGSQAANFRAQGTLRRRQIGSKRSKDVPKKKKIPQLHGKKNIKSEKSENNTKQ